MFFLKLELFFSLFIELYFIWVQFFVWFKLIYAAETSKSKSFLLIFEINFFDIFLWKRYFIETFVHSQVTFRFLILGTDTFPDFNISKKQKLLFFSFKISGLLICLDIRWLWKIMFLDFTFALFLGELIL